MSETTEEQYEGWTILELMGHRRIIGYMKQQEIAGRAFLRVDIPSEPPVTQFYGAEAVYCLTPTTEETARRACTLSRIAPVSQWELPAPQPGKPVEAEIVGDTGEEDRDESDDGIDPWNEPLPLENATTGTRL